jgi:hypothetical protein
MSMSIMEQEQRQAALAAEARRLGLEPWQLEMARAVPTDVVRSIVSDLRRGPPQRSGLAPESDEGARPRGAAVGIERPLAPPPGVALVDRIAEAFDRRERPQAYAAKQGAKASGGTE